uniref:ORF1 protein n=1 Tax=Spodoptera exigua virus AKJ-2014 TaxID=1453322 RepID=A0A023NG79_9PICO|nr:ORF1 protein [Spodoptera exigua virus AKJ-2014]
MSKQHNSKVADGSGLVAVVSPQNANKSNDLCENKDPQKSNMVVTLYDLGLRSRDDVKQLIETGLFPDQLLVLKNDITVHRLNLPKFSRRYRTNELSRKDQLSNIIDGELNGFTVVQGVAYTTSSKAQSSTQLKKRRAKLTKANFAFGLDGLPIQQHGNMTVIQQETNPVDQSLCSDSACVEEEAPVAPVVGDSKTADNISVVCESSAPSERSDLDAICDLIDKLEKSDLAIVYRYAQRKYDQTPGTPVAPAKKSRRKKKKQTVVTPVLSEVEYPALPKVDLPVEIPAEFTEVLDLPKKKKRKQRKARIPLFEVAVDASVEIEQHGNVVSKENNVSPNIAAPASPTKKKKVVYKPFVDQSSPDKPTFDFVLPAKVKQGSSVHQCPIAKYPLHLWKRALNASPSLSIEEVAEKEFKRMVKSSLIHWTLQWKRSSTDRNPWLADWNATIRQLMKYDMKEWYNAYQAFKDRATSFTEKNSNPQWAIEPKQN